MRNISSRGYLLLTGNNMAYPKDPQSSVNIPGDVYGVMIARSSDPTGIGEAGEPPPDPLGWTITGTIAHGSLITVTAPEAVSFGEPDRRWESMVLMDREIRINDVADNFLAAVPDWNFVQGYNGSGTGIATDADSPFYACAAVVLAPQPRHANHDVVYKGYAFDGLAGSGVGSITWPKAFDPTKTRVSTPGDKFFMTWYEYHNISASSNRRCHYTGLTGTFNTGSNSIPTNVGGTNLSSDGFADLGERVLFTTTTGKTALGYITLVDDPFVYLFQDDGRNWFRSDFNGCVVTSVSGDGEMTLVATDEGLDYFSAGGQKSARVYETSAVSGPDGSVQCIVGSHGSITAVTKCPPGSYLQESVRDDNMPLRTWTRRTAWFDYSEADGGELTVALKMGNNPAQIMHFDSTGKERTIGPALAIWGNDPAGGCWNGLDIRYGELIAYTATFCAIVSESATWSEVDFNTSEFQEVAAQISSTYVSLRLHQGSFADLDGKYIYFCSDPDTPLHNNGIALEVTP